MRRSAYRAAFSAGPSTDNIYNTNCFHRMHRFSQPDCILPSLLQFPWLFVVFGVGSFVYYVSNALPINLTESYADLISR